MKNKKVEIIIDDVRIVAELYVDKAPRICKIILNNLGQTITIQHINLEGKMFFGRLILAYPCVFENKCRGEDLEVGDLAYFNPGNQLCFLYGGEIAGALPFSRIGRIVEGLDGMIVIGIKNWLSQGSIMTITREIRG